MLVIRYLLAVLGLLLLVVLVLLSSPAHDSLCSDPPFAWIVGQAC